MTQKDFVASTVVSKKQLSQLPALISSLKHQIDFLNVYLNGFDEIPTLLLQNWINIELSRDHGYRGNMGMLYWIDKLPRGCNYHLLISPDFLWPDDFVMTLLDGLNQNRGKGIVGFGGRRFHKSNKFERAINNGRHYRIQGTVQDEVHVHMLDSRCVMYDTTRTNLDPKDFKTRTLIDLELAITAQIYSWPLRVLPHDPIETPLEEATLIMPTLEEEELYDCINQWRLPGV